MKNFKRIIASSLVIIIACVFAACKKGSDSSESTTLNITLPTATTTEPSSEAVSQEDNSAVTMILTTAYGETMPTVVTTAFNLADEIANDTTTSIDVDPSLTVGVIEIPDVSVSALPTTETTTELTVPTISEAQSEETEPVDNETTTEETTVQTTAQTTTQAQTQEIKSVEDATVSILTDGKVSLDFDPSDWSGGVKTKKISIVTVEIDGKKKAVTGTVIGIADKADNAQIVINTDDLNIAEGQSVNITIPAGAVISKDGTQTSKEMVISVTF